MSDQMVERAHWSERVLRPGEFDVPVCFRVTADDGEAARLKVLDIVDDFERGRGEQHIVPMYVPGMPDSTVEFVRLGFHDCSLNFRTGIGGRVGMGHARACLEAAGGYNAFDPVKVAEVLDRFWPRLSSVEFGRECSPVMYLHLPMWAHQAHDRAAWGDGRDFGMSEGPLPATSRVTLAHEILEAFELEAAADELSFEAYHIARDEIDRQRAWFRNGHAARTEVDTLRVWWD